MIFHSLKRIPHSKDQNSISDISAGWGRGQILCDACTGVATLLSGTMSPGSVALSVCEELQGARLPSRRGRG